MVDSVTVKIRPIKLIAVIFCCIALVLLICSVAGQEWVEVKFVHGIHSVITWGLWEICDGKRCFTAERDWVTVCATFCCISLVFCVTATLSGIMGLCTADLRRRRLWYTIAGIFISLGALSALLAAIIFPVKFRATITSYYVNIKRWDFDWTYGMAWGGIIFSIASAIFFFLPIDHHELEIDSKPF